jgi:3-oxoacyl-[acyl-carrier protein] reductase
LSFAFERTKEMEEGLNSRVALVTGGSRGIGRAVVTRLAQAGVHLAVNYTNDRPAAMTVTEIANASGVRAIAVQADVSQPEQVQELVKEVDRSLGPIDLLVCNAGISVSEESMSFEGWRQTMAVNVDGTVLPIMAIKDGMMERGFGRIVCVASIAGLRPRPLNVAYATSKAAVIALVRNWSGVLAPAIRINAVAPGLIETDMVANMSEERRESMIAGTPLGRIGQPEEIAEMVAFLLSERSSYTTGQTFVAGGGRVTVP